MNAEELTTLTEEMRRMWTRCHSLMDQALTFYNLTFPVKVEAGFDPYRPPTAPRIINSASDHILVGHEVITVPARKDTQEAQKQADKLERGYQALVHRADRNLPGPLLKLIDKNALIFGLGVGKGPLWSKKALDKPEREKGERKADYQKRIAEWEAHRRYQFPIILRPVDPRQVMFPVDIFPPPFVIEVGTRTARYVEATYNITIPGKKPDDPVEWVEYWDKEQRCYLADGIRVLTEEAEENIYGYIPYSLVFSGRGRHPAFGEAGGGRYVPIGPQGLDPAEACQGLLHPVFGALTQQANLLSGFDVFLYHHFYQRLWIEQSIATKISWEPGPAGSIVVPDGALTEGKVKFIEPAKLPPEALQRLSELQQEIERATFSGVIEGVPPQGVEAGYPMAILIGQARMTFGPLLNNLERERENMLANVGRMIEALDETITVWGSTGDGRLDETLTAEDWQGHYEVFVNLSGISPEEADRRAMLGLNLLKAGAISRRTFLEKYAMQPDYTTEENRLMIEKLLESPPLQQALAQEALTSWADEELLAKIKEQQAQVAQQAGIPQRTIGAGAGMPALTPQPPGIPPRPARPGSPEAADLWNRRLQRLIGSSGQTAPIGGPREEVR